MRFITIILLGLCLVLLAQTGHSVGAQGPTLARKFVLPVPAPHTPDVARERWRPLVNAPTRSATKRSFWRPYGPAFKISTAILAGGVVGDRLTTKAALRNPRNFEVNPLLRDKNAGAIYWTAAGGVFGVSLLLERKHPKIASFLRFGVGGAHGVAAGINVTR